ncbi:MAG: hypothetical protein GY859_29355 [Desulfobacterales bacterium]|nr:hypothetical protein [Desulfobacterales bacterium]
MERAARVSRNPDLIFHAARLRIGADHPQNAFPLPRIPGKKKKLKIDGLVTLSTTCIALERMKEAARVMARVIARRARPDHLFNGEFL